MKGKRLSRCIPLPLSFACQIGLSSSLGRLAFSLWLLFGTSGAAACRAAQPDVPYRAPGYHIAEVRNSGIIEHRLYRDGHHFLTVVNEKGTFNMRPHPGEDPNGWGSSLYLQPFLPGAILGHANLETIRAETSHVRIRASGKVSCKAEETCGVWSLHIDLRYDVEQKKIEGAGGYSIDLADELSRTTGDLNLYKLASNYLQDVALLSGGTGDTGDMKVALVSGDNFHLKWVPPEEPTWLVNNPHTTWITVEARGDYNQIDTAADGRARIEAAYKPTVVVTVASRQGGVPLALFAMYDTSKKADFWEDNVGINLLILGETRQRHFDFDLSFSSSALPGDPGGRGKQPGRDSHSRSHGSVVCTK